MRGFFTNITYNLSMTYEETKLQPDVVHNYNYIHRYIA